MDIITGLNDAQKTAVQTTSGPILILAGAGSGKTKTLTHRIAYLLTHDAIAPSEILAVTFTNKAAKEMRARLGALLGKDASSRAFMPWMGTFHSICIQMLRSDGAAIGIKSNFVIYDEDDRRSLVRQIMKKKGLDDDRATPAKVSAEISRSKNSMITAGLYVARPHSPVSYATGQVYEGYESARRAAGALDFDDILLETVNMLSRSADVRQKYQHKFKHVMVDEYQDTNMIQYQLVKQLVNKDRNLCVVGDDAQAIYGWRGADYTNILNFEHDFPGAAIIALEQNYRSTSPILQTAEKVISFNTAQHEKKLWTDKQGGAPVSLIEARDDRDEVYQVINRISQQLYGGRAADDFAVLYRTNAQSGLFERYLKEVGIRYQLIGSRSFLDREVVKDILAYAKLIYQPFDQVSFLRIIGKPKRGVGAKSVEHFLAWAAEQQTDIITALTNAGTMNGATAKAKTSLVAMGELLSQLGQELAEGLAPSELIRRIAYESPYREYISSDKQKADDRWQHADELVAWAGDYHDIGEFLSNVSLVSSADAESESAKVTLMTVHAAKGLEFNTVFLVGLEQGMFPLMRGYEISNEDLEEERRLCYVGITRARKELFVSYARQRYVYGDLQYREPSQFLSEMGVVNYVASPHPSYKHESEGVDAEALGLAIGDRVRSHIFGNGDVVEIDGMAVGVKFDTGKTVKLNVEFARLEKL